MVTTLRSPEKGLGVQAADVIRDRLTGDIPLRTLRVIPKNDVVHTLEASGYSTTEPLNPNDARALATLVRAAEYLDAAISKTPTGYRIDGNLILVSDPNMVQPIPPSEGKSIDDAAKALSHNLQEARKQLDNVTKCNLAVRQHQDPPAIAAARAAIAQYPQSAMGRTCLLQAMQDAKAPSDSIVAVGEQLVAIYPGSRLGWTALSTAYKEKKQEDKYLKALTSLLAADPTNVRLQVQVVNELGAAGKAELAIPIIDQAVQQNPGDPQLLKLQWLILLNAKQYKKAVAVGEELVRTDTSAADTSFFRRLAAAYAADSQPQKAAETLARAAQKFPNNPDFWAAYAQSLRDAGQNQQAVDAINKALAINPKTPNLNLIKSQIFIEMNKPDDAVTALRAARAAGDSAALVGGVALQIGNNLYKAATASKARADFDKAIGVLAFSDSVSRTPQAEFLMGASQLTIGQQLITDAQKDKNCEMAKQAQAVFVDAQINLPKGGGFAPDATKQLLGALAQLAPVADQEVKAYCKGKGTK